MPNFGESLSFDEFIKKQYKPFPGYESLYFVTSDGLVLKTNNLRKIKCSNGSVSLRKDKVNTSVKLDEVVYMLFVDPHWDHVRKIHHIDGDIDNCNGNNLTIQSSIADLPGEIWRKFKSEYEVSSLGRVKFIPNDTLCSLHCENENCMPHVYVDNKYYRIDELVAKVFLGAEDNQVVYHRDGDFRNFDLENLTLDIVIPALEGEIWYDVPEFEDKYKISNFGRVYSLLRKEKRGDAVVTKGGYFLKTSDDSDGYPRVTLVKQINDKDGDRLHRIEKHLHRMVAELLIPNPENKPQINHIDGSKHNNCVSNLEWVTNQENIEHSMSTGLRNNIAKNNPHAYPTIVETSDGVRRRFESIRQASYYLNVDPELLRLYVHGAHKRCKNLSPNVKVYITTKDDYDNVICEPMINYMANVSQYK